MKSTCSIVFSLLLIQSIFLTVISYDFDKEFVKFKKIAETEFSKYEGEGNMTVEKKSDHILIQINISDLKQSFGLSKDCVIFGPSAEAVLLTFSNNKNFTFAEYETIFTDKAIFNGKTSYECIV